MCSNNTHYIQQKPAEPKFIILCIILLKYACILIIYTKHDKFSKLLILVDIMLYPLATKKSNPTKKAPKTVHTHLKDLEGKW